MTQILTPTINAHCQRHIGCVNNDTGIKCPVANSCLIVRAAMSKLDDEDLDNVLAAFERQIEGLNDD